MFSILLFIFAVKPLFCATPQELSTETSQNSSSEKLIHSSHIAKWYLIDDIPLVDPSAKNDKKNASISMKSRSPGTHIFVRRLKPQDFGKPKLVPACAFHKDTYGRITQSYVLLEHHHYPLATRAEFWELHYFQTSLVQRPSVQNYRFFGTLTPLITEISLEVKTLTREKMTPEHHSLKAVACDEENDAHYTEEFLLLPLGRRSAEMICFQISTSQENFFTITLPGGSIWEQPKR